MEGQRLTVENICKACELQPEHGCKEPCETWYRCLDGVPIKDEEVLKDDR
jgi:hypothetical protein